MAKVKGNDGRQKSGGKASPLLIEMKPGHRERVGGLAFSPQGWVLASGGNESVDRLWDLQTGKQVATRERKLHRWAIVAVAFSRDGHLVASLTVGERGSDRGFTQTLLWRLVNNETTVVPRSPRVRHGVSSLAFSPTQDVLAIAGKSIELFDADSGEPVGKPFPDSASHVVAFSPAGDLLASGGNGTLVVWDVARRKRVRGLEGHTDWVNGLAFSANGKELASAGDDGTVRVWEVGTWRERRQWSGDWRSTSYLAFLPGGGLVALHDPGEKAAVRWWPAGGGEAIAWRPEKREVCAAAVSPDGRCLATGEECGRVCLWDTEGVLGHH